MKELEWSQQFSNYKSMGIFADAQGPQSLVGSGQSLNSSEILWLSSSPDPIKNEGARDVTTFSPIITLWKLSVAMETRVLTDLAQNIMQSFPHPNNASDKICLEFAHWSQGYSCLKV